MNSYNRISTTKNYLTRFFHQRFTCLSEFCLGFTFNSIHSSAAKTFFFQLIIFSYLIRKGLFCKSLVVDFVTSCTRLAKVVVLIQLIFLKKNPWNEIHSLHLMVKCTFTITCMKYVSIEKDKISSLIVILSQCVNHSKNKKCDGTDLKLL